MQKLRQKTTEEATEALFENICSFIPRSSFLFGLFSGGSVFTEQIFQESIFVRRTDPNFPEDFFSARRVDINFPGYNYLFAEQILFFLGQGMSVPRTDTNF